MRNRARLYRMSFTGLFGAAAFVLGKIPHPPNVEVVTFALFLAGFAAGPVVGATSGLVLTFIQNVSFGLANPPLVLAQCLAWALIGAAGALFRGRTLRPWLLGLTGFVLTAAYDLITAIGGLAVYGPWSWAGARTTLAMGLPFFQVHILFNTLLFGLGTLAMRSLASHPGFLAIQRLLDPPAPSRPPA